MSNQRIEAASVRPVLTAMHKKTFPITACCLTALTLSGLGCQSFDDDDAWTRSGPSSRCGTWANPQPHPVPVLTQRPDTPDTPAPQKLPQPPAKPQNPSDPVDAIREANQDATVTSSPDRFVNATQCFDYVPGQLYEVICSPRYITTVALKAGENVVSTAGGDTLRWHLAFMRNGQGANAQTLVIVKPLREWVETNLVLTTDQRRLYQINLKSVSNGVYNALVQWNYPDDSLVRTFPGPQPAEVLVDMARVDSNYTITTCCLIDMPAWKPLRVFNDGVKTYIEFGDNAANLPSPVLFAINSTGQAAMVNYRVQGKYFIADTVLQSGRLKLDVNRRGTVCFSHR